MNIVGVSERNRKIYILCKECFIIRIPMVVTKINRNITEDNTWNLFKESYDNLDHDFLKRMKNTHPSLTPSDLKLCAYLRLNLSSKEIAPMLHISIRSVEIKRYRLRKK